MLSGEGGDRLLPFSMPTCIRGVAASVTDTWAVVVKVLNVGLLSVMVVVALALREVPRELLPDRLLGLHKQGSKVVEHPNETSHPNETRHNFTSRADFTRTSLVFSSL